MTEVMVGGEAIVVESFSAQKALRALKIIRSIKPMWDRVEQEQHAYRNTYQANNKIMIDRDVARHQYGPEPLFEEQPATDGAGLPVRDEEGQVLYGRRPVLHEGKPVLGPDPLERVDEETWKRNDQKLVLPRSPGGTSTWLAYLEAGLEEGEQKIYQLAALVAVDEDEISELAGNPTGIDQLLERKAEELVKAGEAHEIFELLVVAAEVIEEQFRPTLERLGGRAWKLPKLLGFGRIMPGLDSTESSKKQPTSSTSSNGDTEPTIPAGSSEPAGALSSPSRPD